MRLCAFLIVLVAVVENVVCVRETKLYDVLGVSPTASERQLKSAYRKLALKNHPDQGGDEQKFMKINNAYEILSDKEKRGIYDRKGEAGLEQQKNNRGRGGSPFDFFSGFGFGGRRDDNPDERRGEDLEIAVQVTLEDLYNGAVYEVNTRNQHICPKCFGSGAKSDKHIHKCSKCSGSGMIIQETRMGPMITRHQNTCDKCGGQGTIIAEKCPHCGGKKLVLGEKTLHIDIERGMPDGEKIVFEHEADEHPEMAAGNLVFRVSTLPHDLFQRQGNDLHVYTSVSLEEALIGFTMFIDQLDGRTVTFEHKKIIKPDQIEKIKGEGMPHMDFPSDKGDMYLHFKVRFPDSLTDAQKQTVRELHMHR